MVTKSGGGYTFVLLDINILSLIITYKQLNCILLSDGLINIINNFT